jgi:hypothetical protein
MFMRRRPLLGAAVIGAAAYHMGKKGAQASQQEADQNQAIADLQAQQAPPQREEGAEAGAIAGAAAFDEGGTVFNDEDVRYLADALPVGMAAAVALLEHRWAIPLRDAIRANDGVPLLDRWLHPEDLVAAGMEIGMEITAD